MHLLIVFGLLSASIVYSHPTNGRSGLRRRLIDLSVYRLNATAKYSNSVETASNPSVQLFKRDIYVDTAIEFAKSTVPGAEFRVSDDHYIGNNGIAHVNLKQTAHGLDIDNADFNINIGPDGKVFSYGNNFYVGATPDHSPLRRRDFSEPTAALEGAKYILQLPVTGTATAVPLDRIETYSLKGTSGAVRDPEARLVYLVKDDGNLALTWRVETDILDNWLLTYVDAVTSREIHGVVDYVAHATYLVYKWGLNDPTEGERTVVEDPWNPNASPFTWHGDGMSTYNTTRGNNGIAQTNPSGGSSYLNNYRPESATLNFQYPYSPSSSPPSSYADASVTQLFYTANKYHDLLYILGFTEAAGNFEINNNGKGGKGNDLVILSAQDGAGTDNADFTTPPDGQNGRMRMYIWDFSTPVRDCTFEAGVIIHEYSHGLSNRLTGGPANSNCLNALESGGMGEGWGDFLATAIRVKMTDTRTTDYPMGAWVYNNPAGIRQYLYSTNMTTNPMTYATLDSQNEVHAIGTVWATMLLEVFQNLVDKYGKTDSDTPVFDGKVPTDGRYLTMKLVIDGMALQPCNPNFVQSRDAILDADKALTGGVNSCAIWTGFAKRGLGEGAKYSSTKRTASFAVPSGVC